MLSFPKSTEFGRRIPKNKFYEHLEITPDVKRIFVDQIKAIYWSNKLTASTMNIAPGQEVSEIEVFHIQLQANELDAKALRLMDRQIPYHILFILERPSGEQQLYIGYKELSQNKDLTNYKFRQAYSSTWQNPENLSLTMTALDMDALYESFVRQIAGDLLTESNYGALKNDIELAQKREKLQKQIDQLTAKMKKEKQFNRQMELRREIRELEHQYDC